MKSTAPSVKVHFRIDPAFVGKVRRTSLQRAVQAAFESAGEERGGELTLVVTDDDQVRELNRTYRNVNATTDVLAFGDSNGIELPVHSPDAPLYFGDIVISYPRAVEQATTYDHSIEEELSLLVIHGTLHLLGYDHEQEQDREEMWRLQSAALARLGLE